MAQFAMSSSPPDFADIQGLLRFGFGHLSRASFLLLEVKDRDAARAWLASVAVTSAEAVNPLPAQALQVALSSDGLRALDVADGVIEGFANEFVAGMSRDPGRSRRLGDVDSSAPASWCWGAGSRIPHVLVMLYANSDSLPALERSVREQCAAGFGEVAVLGSAELDDREPFGFVDGISQPQLDWDRRRPVRDRDELDYLNLSCLGEFVLGYPNEYGCYTDRPLLPAQGAANGLPPAEDAPDKRDLGKNGTYLVMRQLRQEVFDFWRYVERRAGGDPVLREQLAAAMVGRTLDGVPLVDPAAGRRSNAFTYEADAKGRRCPLGAHIRRSNPRNADLPPRTKGLWSRLTRILGFDAAALEVDHVASTRFHRLVRRGRKYGPNVPQAIALDAAREASAETGLYFICLNGNISRQFEFVQSAWIANTKFDGLVDESDPLLGQRPREADGRCTGVFSMPQAHGADRRLTELPTFVTVRGGAYFFLPGLRALRYLATAT
jgi:deferrochelatase/peroxidase EfeB